MRPLRRRATLALAAIAGVVVAVVATMASARTDGPEPGSSPPSRAVPSTTEASTPDAPPPDPVLLVWTSGGLPAGFAAEAAAVPGVVEVAVVRGDQAAMVAASAEGRVVEQLTDGWRIPLDTLAVDPTTFSSFLPEPAATMVRGLEPGEAVLTETSADVRGVGAGAVIELEGGVVTVRGVIDDVSGAGAEILVTAAQAPALGIVTERYLLLRHTADRPVLERALAGFLDGRAVRFRTPAETTWLRHGDAVEPNLFLKEAFGEFAYRDGQGRGVEISPAWVERWIVTEAVPILGPVTCHREVIGPLRAALRELSDAGLGHLVDPADFAGCFSARRIEAGQPLSHHAWGAALDLNVDGNPRGSFSSQDPRLVEAMADHGFTWGGAWLVPDPAHYEAPLPASPG